MALAGPRPGRVRAAAVIGHRPEGVPLKTQVEVGWRLGSIPRAAWLPIDRWAPAQKPRTPESTRTTRARSTATATADSPIGLPKSPRRHPRARRTWGNRFGAARVTPPAIPGTPRLQSIHRRRCYLRHKARRTRHNMDRFQLLTWRTNCCPYLVSRC